MITDNLKIIYFYILLSVYSLSTMQSSLLINKYVSRIYSVTEGINCQSPSNQTTIKIKKGGMGGTSLNRVCWTERTVEVSFPPPLLRLRPRRRPPSARALCSAATLAAPRDLQAAPFRARGAPAAHLRQLSCLGKGRSRHALRLCHPVL